MIHALRTLLAHFLIALARRIEPTSLAKPAGVTLLEVMDKRKKLYKRVHEQYYVRERVRKIDFEFMGAGMKRMFVTLSGVSPYVKVHVFPDGPSSPKTAYEATALTADVVCQALLGDTTDRYFVHGVEQEEGSVLEQLADIDPES